MQFIKPFVHKALVFLFLILFSSGMYCQEVEAESQEENQAEEESTEQTQTQKQRDFIQKIEWEEDANALEYELIIQTPEGAEVLRSPKITQTFFEFSIAAGEYQYCIIAYDFLGHEASKTEWHPLTITKALKPEIVLEKNTFDVPRSGKKNTVEIPVDIEKITSDSVVELVNTKTGERITGTLVTEEVEDSASYEENEVKSSSASFENVQEGDWKLVITNPSGYSNDSEVITVSREAKEPLRYGEINLSGTVLFNFILTDTLNTYAQNESFLIQNLLGYGGAFNWLFLEFDTVQFGVSLDYAHAKRIKQKDAVFDLNLTFDAANLSLLFRKNFLDKKIGLDVKAGAGFLLVTEGINYHGNYSKMAHNPLYYGYICYEGGLAFNWIPFKHMIVEAGVDFIYAPMNQMQGMFLWPYLNLGLRF